MKRYFITGTDTDCGKTYVATKILQKFPSTAALKPIASGTIFKDETWVNNDAWQLQQCSNLSLAEINPWSFSHPIAPHIAAMREGVCIEARDLVQYCLDFHREGLQNLFIEGAGGLCVPFNEKQTWIDFLKLSQGQIETILVVGMRLGCINHALLTQMALKSSELRCIGWIANCLDEDMLELTENIRTLKNLLQFPLLATLPFQGDFIEDDHLAKLICFEY